MPPSDEQCQAPISYALTVFVRILRDSFWTADQLQCHRLAVYADGHLRCQLREEPKTVVLVRPESSRP